MKLSGLPEDLVEECSHEDTLIFPDNWKSVSVFRDMQTQWRVGAIGAIGLDYTALETIPTVRRIKDDDEYEEVFSDLQMMERAALQHIREEGHV